MSTKRWRMSVMELGSDSNVEEVTIEADNWMTALRLGRASMGESGGVPTGSSCAVAGNGRVTILDPIDRRRFVLQLDSTASYRPPASTPGMKIPSDPIPRATPKSTAPVAAAPVAAAPVAAAPANAPLAPASPAAVPSPLASPPQTQASPAPASTPAPSTAPAPKKRKRARTMAYIPDPRPTEKKRTLKQTMAYVPATPVSAPSAQSSVIAEDGPTLPEQDAADVSGFENTVETSAVTIGPDGAPQKPNAIVAAVAEAKVEAKLEAEVAAETRRELDAAAQAQSEVETAAAKAAALARAQAEAEVARLQLEAEENDAKVPNDDDEGRVAGVSWRVLHRRDADPSDASPLTYRERSYVVDAGTSDADAEAVAIARALSLMGLLADGPKGRFVNVAIFDHSWNDQPKTPPMVTVAEKDWQERTVEHPLRSARQSAAPPARKRATTNDHDRRLSDAFEACQDLLFVASPLEGVEFCHRLLEDLIPCGAVTACLYDIDDNVHRVVSTSGIGGELRRGHAIPQNAGLFGVVTASGRPLLIRGDDPRLDVEHDGREGLEIDNGLYLASVHNGRHLATIQMLNRKGSEFSAADADLGSYIALQLGEFLNKARGSLHPHS